MNYLHYPRSLDLRIGCHFLTDTFWYPFSFSFCLNPIVIVGLMPHQLIGHLLQACQLPLKGLLEDHYQLLLLQMHRQGSQWVLQPIPSLIFMNGQKHYLLLKPLLFSLTTYLKSINKIIILVAGLKFKFNNLNL